MEQKMVATTSVPVKAVTCHLCNYTSFKASELCREKGHRVKVIDAKKRFFKCGDCKNRTVSLDRLPKVGQLPFNLILKLLKSVASHPHSCIYPITLSPSHLLIPSHSS